MTHRPLLVSLVACSLLPSVACKDDGDDLASDALETNGTDGTAGDTDDTDTAAGAVDDPTFTYWRDAKAVIDAKCGDCHQPDDIAPFSLTTYEEVAAVAAVLPASLMAESMPPWFASDQCQQYAHDRSLEPEELELLLTWLDEGAPEGDPADAPAAGPDDSGEADWAPTVTLQMPEPYTPTQEPDDYRCFVMPWSQPQSQYVTGYRVRPGNRSIVHHVILFSAGPEDAAEVLAMDEADPGPGYTCFGGSGVRAGSVGSWVPGTDITRLPEDTGVAVEPGSMMIMQLHYNTSSSTAASDQTSIELELRDEVASPGRTLPVTNFGWPTGLEPMHIPAGDPAVSHSFEMPISTLTMLLGSQLDLEPGQPLLVHSLGMHMHYLGTRGRLSVIRDDDHEDCLLQIDDWDFNWQGNYELREPIPVMASDRVRIDCTWDNSAGNQPVIDGEIPEPQDVQWGEGTRDEMCLGSIYVTAG